MVSSRRKGRRTMNTDPITILTVIVLIIIGISFIAWFVIMEGPLEERVQ